MKTKLRHSNRGFTLIELLVVITIIAILAGAAVPTFNSVQEKANQSATIGNAKQIATALKIYAGDNNGSYPDSDPAMPTTSNAAFALLIQQDVLQDERIFTAKASKYVPDGNIGMPPAYTEALQAGENHWAMTAGITDSASAQAPVVFENAIGADWPPTWNADAAGKTLKGRTWRGGKIVVAFNDTSVTAMKLEAPKGPSVGPADLGNGMNIFTQYQASGVVLDILE
jgi:prepilin-type N-terminal cleavage/methylation domain-containing protein